MQGLLDDLRASKLRKIQEALERDDLVLLEAILAESHQAFAHGNYAPKTHALETGDPEDSQSCPPAKRRRVQSSHLQISARRLMQNNEVSGKEVIDLTQDE